MEAGHVAEVDSESSGAETMALLCLTNGWKIVCDDDEVHLEVA
jgi:hypothetical protein